MACIALLCLAGHAMGKCQIKTPELGEQFCLKLSQTVRAGTGGITMRALVFRWRYRARAFGPRFGTSSRNPLLRSKAGPGARGGGGGDGKERT